MDPQPPQNELVQGMHGVIREYASLAPTPNATPIAPIINAPLTDTSITLGSDDKFYMTGSAVDNQGPIYANDIHICQSENLRVWTQIRTLNLDQAVQSPEIHFLNDKFYLTLSIENSGTALLQFDTPDIQSSTFTQTEITREGDTPSIFLDEDGTFYWVLGAGEIAQMESDPMKGLRENPQSLLPPEDSSNRRSNQQRGAFLAKIGGFYHLFVSERKLRHGDIGRTGLVGGTSDTYIAVTDDLKKGFAKQYLGFPCAGQTTLFRDQSGALWATYSCDDERGTLRHQPGVFKVEQANASEPTWSIGFDFDGRDIPELYTPPGFFLRPDTSSTYEKGIGTLKAIPMEPAPSIHRDFPWIRDTSIILGHDNNYYMTGTSGDMDSIHIWRSSNLKSWEHFHTAFTFETDPELWYNRDPKRLLWAPEIHYLKGTYWLAWSANRKMGLGLLKSTTGNPEGPYVPANEGNRPFGERAIDASLFEDSDGTVYFIWLGRFLRKMNENMDGLEGEILELKTVDGEQVGYEGIFMARINDWYVVLAAEWNGGWNRTCGTYDMMYSVSRNLEGPYTQRRVGVPHGGHSTLFQNPNGDWNLAIFGNDRSAPFRAMPGVVPLSIKDTGDDLIISPNIQAV